MDGCYNRDSPQGGYLQGAPKECAKRAGKGYLGLHNGPKMQKFGEIKKDLAVPNAVLAQAQTTQ